jgi:nitrogen-specific signal transduction histidine kinase
MSSDNRSKEEIEAYILELKSGIREIAHEINNPLGVLRMATYLMETTNPDEQKRKHYVALMNTSIDKIETGLKRLRALRDNPPVSSSNTTQNEQP